MIPWWAIVESICLCLDWLLYCQQKDNVYLVQRPPTGLSETSGSGKMVGVAPDDDTTGSRGCVPAPADDGSAAGHDV